MNMGRAAVVVLVASVLGTLAPPAIAVGNEVAEKVAVASAQSWLALVDAGKYAESWDAAASMFRAAVTKPDWVRMVGAVRAPLGSVASRAVTTTKYTTTLPGAPDGQYVVVRFATSFGHKASAVETVTPTLDKDGVWRVSGYFIK
jgi:hypothetical protein